MLITLSGIDSSGKTTQINNAIDYYSINKIIFKVIWSRGGYTSIFNRLKHILRKMFKNAIPDAGESPERDKIFKKKWVATLWLNISLIDMIIFYVFFWRDIKCCT